MRKGLYFAGSCLVAAFYGGSLQYVVLAQDQDKPAVAPLPRTINLTQEQRYIIKENVKDLPLPRAPCKRTRNDWRHSARGHQAILVTAVGGE